jgi:hypothetical protein
MRILLLVLITAFIALNSISQVINFTDNTLPNDIKEFSSLDKNNAKWFIQFVIPIDENGISVNNGLTLRIEGLSNLNSYRIKLAEYKTQPVIYYLDAPLNVNNHIATYPITFNGTNQSTVYKIIIYNGANEVNFQGIISGTNYPVEYYIVTERSKTGTFANSPTNFAYKINWVEYWLNNHPNPAQFRADAEQALKFSWQKQINEWGLCDGLANNQPIDDNNEFDLNIDGYNQTSFPYRGCRSSNATMSVNSRNVSIDFYSYQMGDSYSNYSTELSLLHSLIAHAFFHNVQYSHNLNQVMQILGWFQQEFPLKNQNQFMK